MHNTMDSFSFIPPEVAFQILGKLSSHSLFQMLQTSRYWYTLCQDQSVWKQVFEDKERPFAIPKPLPRLSSLTTSSFYAASPSSIASSASIAPAVGTLWSNASFTGREGIDTTMTTAASTTTTAPPPPTSTFSSSTLSTSTTTSTTSLSRDITATPTEQDEIEQRDWKSKCRKRMQSDRNWSRGHVQSILSLKIHRGWITRLRIKEGRLISADVTGTIAIWETETFECLGSFEALPGQIQLLDFAPKSMIMTVVGTSGQFRIWDLQNRTVIHSAMQPGIACMTMDDNYVVFGGSNGEVSLVDFKTGRGVKSLRLTGHKLQDIYLQNDTMVIVTFKDVRIYCLDTLKLLLTCPMPTISTLPNPPPQPVYPSTLSQPQLNNNQNSAAGIFQQHPQQHDSTDQETVAQHTQTPLQQQQQDEHIYCSVYHIRSLVVLIDRQILHFEWEPLLSNIRDSSKPINPYHEAPPDLSKPPTIHRTKVPPISTITSIAIGGKHPHVLTTNADYSSLNGTIRYCARDNEKDGAGGLEAPADDKNVVLLTSPCTEVADFMDNCGLMPSFMDVDDDLIVIGSNRGDLVVLHMI